MYRSFLNKKAFECFEFGRVALEENDTYHAMRWLSEAFDLVQLEIDEETGTNDELLKTYIDITYYLSIATARVSIYRTMAQNVLFAN